MHTCLECGREYLPENDLTDMTCCSDVCWFRRYCKEPPEMPKFESILSCLDPGPQVAHL